MRISGVETGSDRYNALLSQYHGVLAQFHLGQQQQAIISGQRYYKASRTAPGVRMTYQNNDGQETITLELTTSGGGEEAKVDKEEYWSWAIVEMKVPDIQGRTSFEASAFMNPPPSNGKFGIALNKTHPYDVDAPPLSYPIDELGTFIEDVQDNDGYASLRVDLRPFPGGVKFDLYGYIRKYQDGTHKGDPTGAFRTMSRSSNAVSPGGGSYTTRGGTHVTAWFAAGDISGRTQTNYIYKASGTPHTSLADIAASFPALPGPFTPGSILPPEVAPWGDGSAYGGEGITWTPGSGNFPDESTMNLSGLISAAGGLFTETTTLQADGVSFTVRGLGAQTYTQSSGFTVTTLLNGAGPNDADGNWSIIFFDYTIYYVADHPDVPTIVFPDRDCPINFVVLDDGPDAMTNRYGDPLKMNSYRWETTKKYPARWPMKELPTKAFMKAIDDSSLPFPSTANHFSMIKLGTVTINPKKGKGGIKFIAA